MVSLIKDDVIQAWYMDNSDMDQRLPHHRTPNEFVPLEKLKELGVLTWRLDADNYENDEELKEIRKARGYNHMEVYDINPEKFSKYLETIEALYQEHFHTFEEVSFCISGSGYYDVRDCDESWIRISLKKGAMIILPAGIYHRSTTDSNDFFKIMILHSDDFISTPYNRSNEHLPERKQYIDTFVKKIN
ncbi:acireductone dioxygenase 3-like isoform X1 [Andrographis paniculata]|uniref:acireductone dioxygenase 3-like isoform X1 n=1 Tax=Andrographis paniculata TaxID=175694 RepID=UPI0021E9AD94|nr:acireductone dioxygenase 3-like isoform X1 [Andrographis paniculata]